MFAIKILYVDDEEQNLQAFKASYRRQYTIYTASSARAAEQLLSETPGIQIIISDQRMPEKTGVAFFKEIRKTYPDAIRILLTGYTDIEVLAEAVNEGHIYRYITKPWNEIELTNIINNAFEAYKNRSDLKEKINQLQKSNDELNRFIYSISHELRAPIATALGALQLARFENLIDDDSVIGEYWQMIEHSCNRLDYNINATLQYYKNRRIDAEFEKIDFNELIGRLIKVHKNFSGFENEVTFDCNVKQPVDFFGDAFRIEVILGNLISNAVKYQKPGPGTKKVSINAEGDRSEMAIKIEDNGIGISPQNIEKIYAQFFRGNLDKGTGLGLFIAKEALDKLNGAISVQSDLNNGTIFTVTIPNCKKAH